MTGPGPLRVDADLRVEVGGCSATVTGSGRRVVVDAENPLHFWTELNRSSLPWELAGVPLRRSVAHAAAALAAARGALRRHRG